MKALLLLSLPAAMLAVGACSSSQDAAARRPDTVTTMSGLRYIDYVPGTGNLVESGMEVSVDYAGYLTNGKLFDTSLDSVARVHGLDRGGEPYTPIKFLVGTGQVIRGWDEGLTTNLRVGGHRRLIIPSALGYGAQNAGPIPPNSTLIFDVHVRAAERPANSAAPRR